MFKKFLQQLQFKKMARQLRKPAGATGIETGFMMNKSNEILYDFTLDTMRPANQESILEIGFGNGKFFEKVVSKAEGLKLSGIDYSETMVVAAREINSALLYEDRLTLVSGNSDQLPYKDNCFDKVFCINVVYFWDHPGNHLREIYRVLKPGGKFYTTVRSKESLNYMPFTKYGFTGYTDDEWKKLVEQHQFKFNSVSTLDEPIRDFNGHSIQFRALCMVAEK